MSLFFVINHTFVFYLALLTQCIRPVFFKRKLFINFFQIMK